MNSETQKTSPSSSPLLVKLLATMPVKLAILVVCIAFVGLLFYFRVSILPSYQMQQRYIHESEHIAERVLQAYTGLHEISRRQPGVSVSENVLKPLSNAKSTCQILLAGGEIKYSHIGHIYKAYVEKIRFPDAREALENTSRAIQEFANQATKQSGKRVAIESRFNLALYRRLALEVEASTTRFETVVEHELRQSQMQDALLINGLILIFSAMFLSAIYFARRGLKQIRITNEQLTESVERNKAIVDTAVEGIFITDKSGIIQFANRAIQKLFGYKSDELLGQNVSLLIPARHSKKHNDYIEDHVNGKPSRIIGTGREVKGLHKNGTEFPMHIGVGSSYVSGQLCFTGIVWDLSKERESEKRVADSEKELSAILQNMQDTYYRVDLDGKLQRISPSVKKLLGYEVEELIGTKLGELYANADGREEFLQALQKSNGHLRNYEAQLTHKQGSGVWVSTNAQYVKDRSGVITGIEGTTRDISEKRYMEQALRESETKFRTLAESSNAGIFIYQGERLVYVNPAEARLTGYDVNELFTMDFWDLVHPDFLETAREWAAAEARGEEVPQNRELKLRTKDGKTVWVEYSGTLVSYNNEPAGMGTIIDITHLKKAEQELQQTKEELEQRVEERTQSLVQTNKELVQEIDERQQAESALREKALIIDQIHESVVSTDLEGNITSWNKGAERLFGFRTEEMVGKFIGLVYPDDQQEFLLNEVIAPLKAKGAHEAEVKMTKKNGELFDANLFVSMLYNEQKEPIGMIGYTLDITQRKIAEEKIDQDYHEQTAVNAILKSSLELYGLDEQLGLALDQLLLMPRFENILNANVFLVEDPKINGEHTSGTETVSDTSTTKAGQFGKKLQGRTAAYRERQESDTPDQKSHSITAQHLSMPISSLGKLLGVLNIDFESVDSVSQQDQDFLRVIATILAGVIERSHAQNSLADALRDMNMIMNTVQDIIIKIDTHGRLISWNKELEVVTGYLPEELWGATADKFFSPENLPLNQRAIKDAAETGYGYVEANLRLRDGNEVPYQWIISVLKDDNGEIIGYTSAARDLSDRIEAEAQRLQDAERQRDTLVREVHHRVKNNLQGIVGLLRHYTVENPDTKDVLENAIGQIHSIALMYGLQSKHAHDEVMLSDMITAIAENAQGMTNAIVAIAPGEDSLNNLAISAKDNVTIALVLNELIYNAIKHNAQSGTTNVEISLCQLHGAAKIIITNQGQLKTGFNWTKSTGLGTGLNLVKSLLPTQGAAIAIYNKDDLVITELVLSAPVLVEDNGFSETALNDTQQIG